ncbi:hypothetical protein EOE18_10530 [Novosphingobium umbonatum]|uniref:Uncharacterized protein n=1 Tax=Novosphingobium umbonatum TaxID=1908524 RepID=A0A437N3V8_9SPHN|nr:hypothetical protein EOE18_10530 [Novosphingobium umbonatum]
MRKRERLGSTALSPLRSDRTRSAVSSHAGDDPRSKLRPPMRPHFLFQTKGGGLPPSRQGPGRLRACRATLGGRRGFPTLPSLRFVQGG